MKTVAIVQARMGSTRLPGKVLKLIQDRPLIGVLLERLSKSRLLDEVAVATTSQSVDDPLAAYVESLDYTVIRGDAEDVLRRYILAAEKLNADVIVRITGDCPLVDPVIVDDVISIFRDSSVDYASNIQPPSFPDGLDVEVFSTVALKQAHLAAVDNSDKEHVTPVLRRLDASRRKNLFNTDDQSHLRLTVDEPEDLELVRKIFSNFSPDINFGSRDIFDLYLRNPDLFVGNQNLERNVGMKLNSGQKLWTRAKRSIPGGNMLLSKRPEMFLPDKWPVYFSKASGCEVWDLDSNRFFDLSTMGVGTNILGYSNPEVNEAVIEAVNNGTMSTLNCPEEVTLAERLVSLHPWADMVRFARSGGEANAIAIRIARAASGKDGVAICGYHGWHDWYLAANLGGNDGLDGHLLPGLQPNGVPKELAGSVHPFEYNDLEALSRIINNHEIGVIKMEVIRNKLPSDQFLQKVRSLANEKNIVLVFDECTSGFRECLGGIHLNFGVEPDIAMFGKALGNGHPITAVVGKRNVMEAAQSTFISSTFWTDRVGPVAAIKTLDIMERELSWNTITRTGEKIRSGWKQLSKEKGVPIEISGIASLSSFSFRAKDPLVCKTFITQEMLKKGFLASTAVYVSISHSDDIVHLYLTALGEVFDAIAGCENSTELLALLDVPVCHDGFRRLN